MMSIRTPLYDLNGFILFQEAANTSYPELSRRVTRTATLDGNSTINDMGYSDSDNSYIIRINNMPQSDILKLSTIIKTYALVYLSTREGVFYGAISSLNTANDPAEFTFLIKNRASE